MAGILMLEDVFVKNFAKKKRQEQFY